MTLIGRAGVANYPVTDTRSLFRRLWFFTQAYTRLGTIARWIHDNTPCAMQIELERSTALLKSISNPYIHTRWSIQERMHALTTHYRLISALDLQFLNFSGDCYWSCTEFVLGDKNFRIILDRQHWMRAEGELIVSLFMGIDRLYAIAFSLGGEPAARKMLVGAIQGMHGVSDSSLYSDLTKLFHGVRPRDLMLNIAKMVAQHMGCKEVLAIADDCHQSLGRGNEFARAAKYDDIWTENGGTRNEAGFFVLGTAFNRRADADIPARKRALYRRRYEFFESLEKSIGEAFGASQKTICRHEV